MDKFLELTITNQTKNKMVIKINNPAEGLTDEVVKSALQTIADSKAFIGKDGALDIPTSARLVTVDYSDYNLA